jgi:hypothetical protein
MRFRVLTVVVAVALLLSVVPLMAHHAAQAQYDKDSQQEITGVMKRVQWINPHVRWILDVTNDDYTVTSWEISGSGPGGYRRNGISARGVFPVGETYTALIALARDGSAGGYIMTWTLPNGAVLDFWHDYGAR